MKAYTKSPFDLSRNSLTHQALLFIQLSQGKCPSSPGDEPEKQERVGTVNGDRYRVMITNFFIPELNNHDVQELWFPTRRRNMSHSSCHNRFIERHVCDRLISRFGPVNWPQDLVI
ncbi:hypothetical protein TNCV_111231 [Trichonephila clavipes]|nr:hypothetical protein TNCV_111231 [Trichonephila clavipes]